MSEVVTQEPVRVDGFIRYRHMFSSVLIRLGSLGFVLAVWALLAAWTPSHIIPPPGAVLSQAWQVLSDGSFGFHMGQTLRRVLIGFGVAMLISLPLGIAMGSLRWIEKFFEIEIVIGLTVPGLMWALIALILFGLSEVSAYFAVAITILPMLVINVWHGMKAIDRDLIDMSNVFHASAWSKVVDVLVPQLLSHLFAATRYGLGLAWKVVVLVEMFGYGNGIGYQILQSYHLFALDRVLTWTITFTLLMLALEYGVISTLERRYTAWRPQVTVWR